jgi:hypothetical protein
MWGPRDFGTIEINSELYEVRVNLWQALFHLRLENKLRVLWIDALCINQADVNERNHQVTQMGKIYRNASRVVVWLGESDSASSTAIKMLREAGLGNIVAYGSLFRNYSIGALNDLHSIFLRKYWSRLWIVQEVALAWEVRVQCGTDVIAWDYLVSLVLCIDTISLFNDQYIPAIESLPRVPDDKAVLIQSLRRSALAKLVRRRSSTKEMLINNFDDSSHSLLHLCSDHGAANCIDPRDKIFGLHALSQKCCTDAVPVDYSLSLFQILTRVHFHLGLSHGDPQKLVSECWKFHDVLRLSLVDLNEILKMRTASLSRENHYDEPLCSVRCLGTSRISYVYSLSEEEVTRKQ